MRGGKALGMRVTLAATRSAQNVKAVLVAPVGPHSQAWSQSHCQGEPPMPRVWLASDLQSRDCSQSFTMGQETAARACKATPELHGTVLCCTASRAELWLLQMPRQGQYIELSVLATLDISCSPAQGTLPLAARLPALLPSPLQSYGLPTCGGKAAASSFGDAFSVPAPTATAAVGGRPQGGECAPVRPHVASDRPG